MRAERHGPEDDETLPRCRSSFKIAGPLCQVMALGVVAQRVNARLEFDINKKVITNHALANQLLTGPPPRKNWGLRYYDHKNKKIVRTR